MKYKKDEYILIVKDKNNLNDIQNISDIIFISSVTNIVGIKLKNNIHENELKNIDNIIHFQKKCYINTISKLI